MLDLETFFVAERMSANLIFPGIWQGACGDL